MFHYNYGRLALYDEFVSFKLALDLEKIGFNEPCLALYSNANPKTGYYTLKEYRLRMITQRSQINKGVKAPLWQQVFNWFRKEHNLDIDFQMGYESGIKFYVYDIVKLKSTIITSQCKFAGKFKTYEKARKDCLKKLIKIVKEQSHCDSVSQAS